MLPEDIWLIFFSFLNLLLRYLFYLKIQYLDMNFMSFVEKIIIFFNLQKYNTPKRGVFSGKVL